MVRVRRCQHDLYVNVLVLTVGLSHENVKVFGHRTDKGRGHKVRVRVRVKTFPA